tara:strand:+ start:562 stop:810 length:249 start_codon:yes stop_codon:yes gene_type:complete
MIIIIVFSAVILAWFFIEITLFLANKNYFNFDKSKSNISYKKFVWTLRILSIFLILITILYMYSFENDKLLKAIEYCLGVIR